MNATKPRHAPINWRDEYDAQTKRVVSMRADNIRLRVALVSLINAAQYAVNRLDTDRDQPQVSGDLAVNLAIARAALGKAT